MYIMPVSTEIIKWQWLLFWVCFNECVIITLTGVPYQHHKYIMSVCCFPIVVVCVTELSNQCNELLHY